MSRPLPSLALALSLFVIAGCPEGPRMEQWTPEKDPHPPAAISSADARRAAEKEEDEGLAAALASAKFGEGGLGLKGTGESAGKAEGIGLSSIGPFGAPATKSPASPRMVFSKVELTGSLPPEVIQRIVRHRRDGFRSCWVKAAEADRYLQGKVTLSFVVTREGTVDVAKTKATAEGDAEPLTACMKDVLNLLTFPSPESGVVKASFSIDFSPGERDGTIHGKPLSDVTLEDVTAALTEAGYSKLAPTPRGDSGVQVISATKGDETILVTFVPFEEKRARLTAEEWDELDAAAVVHHYLGFGLAVKASDRKTAKAALTALIQPAPLPKGP